MENMDEFWHLISLTLGDQTLKFLLIDALSRWRSGVQGCRAGRIPRWEDSFVFFLVEM